MLLLILTFMSSAKTEITWSDVEKIIKKVVKNLELEK